MLLAGAWVGCGVVPSDIVGSLRLLGVRARVNDVVELGELGRVRVNDVVGREALSRNSLDQGG